MQRLLMLLALAVPAAARTAAAQQPGDAAASREAMQRLAWLEGTWRGGGWMQMGRTREDATVVETARFAAGNTVMVIEGLGTRPDPAGGPPRAVHQAFGIVWYDAVAREHRMRAWRVDGGMLDPTISVRADTLVWGFKTPQGQVRFTVTKDPEGRWHEVGHFAADGTTWQPFFEMRLEKTR